MLLGRRKRSIVGVDGLDNPFVQKYSHTFYY